MKQPRLCFAIWMPWCYLGAEVPVALQVMDFVRRIMARYRRGDYVPEHELEFAFQQLERQFVSP
jgi:hypothetical protein